MFRNEPMNFDPRERVIVGYQEGNGSRNVFLGFSCHLTRALKENGSMSTVFAVNAGAAIASVWLRICLRRLREK